MNTQTPTPLHSPPSAPPKRSAALDVARALAVIGMIAVNVGPQEADDLLERIFMLPFGRASLLFVFLAGIGLGMLTHPAKHRPWRQQWTTLVWRALLLLGFGLALQPINHGVSVILAVYGVLFLVGIPLTRLRTTVLAWLTGILMLAAPVFWMGLLVLRGEGFSRAPILLSGNPLGILDGILVTGPYPALVWIVPLVAGLTLSRLDLRHRRLQLILLFGGMAAAAGGIVLSRLLAGVTGIDPTSGGFARLLASYDHSQAPLWLVSGIGSAAAVIGMLLLVEPWLERHALPLVHLGRLSFTMYVMHLVLLAIFVRPDPHTTIEGIAFAALISTFCIICAHLWVPARGQGPLERLLRLPARLTRRPATISSGHHG